jgi:predicted DNA-binding transcriptional regulator AlpA
VTKSAQPRLVDERQAATILGMSVKTLQRWRWAGREVPFIKLGGSVRYDLRDLQTYIDEHRCHSTSLARTA